MAIQLTSPAFAANERIPKVHTADDADVSPPLLWSGLPDGTQQLALVVDDPDAPRPAPFVHWVIYGIPAGSERLPGEIPREKILTEPVPAVQGTNDFGGIGYGGPAPPKGHGVHHYHFTLYALDEKLDLAPGLTKDQLLNAMAGHVLATGELVGTYER